MPQLAWLLFAVFCGPVYLLLLVIVDTVKFVIALFDESSPTKNMCTLHNKYKEIDIELFRSLTDLILNSNDKVDVKEIILLFQEKLKVKEQVSAMLFGTDLQSDLGSVDQSDTLRNNDNCEKVAMTNTFSYNYLNPNVVMNENQSFENKVGLYFLYKYSSSCRC